jgi:hypothetical protein
MAALQTKADGGAAATAPDAALAESAAVAAIAKRRRG